MKKEEKDLITIIIPVYNVEEYIGRCLESARNQTYHNLEILVIDDGTEDDSSRIAEEYAQKDERIRVIHQENAGLSGARNTGIEEACGEWILFVDSDDEMVPDSVETLYHAAIANHTKMSMGGYYQCSHYKDGERMKEMHIPTGVYKQEELIKYFLTIGKNQEYIWTKLFHRSIWEEIRFPKGKVYEDIFTMPLVLQKAQSCVMIDHLVYKYHIRIGSISMGKNLEKQFDGLDARLAQKKFMEQYYPDDTKYVEDLILETCCWLFGKVEQAGKKENILLWQRLRDTFARERKKAPKKSILIKGVDLCFCFSPAFVSKMMYWYTYLKWHKNI